MTMTATAPQPTEVSKMTDAELLALPEVAMRLPKVARLVSAAQKRRENRIVFLRREIKNRRALSDACYANANSNAMFVHLEHAREMERELNSLTS